jgi:putative transposase
MTNIPEDLTVLTFAASYRSLSCTPSLGMFLREVQRKAHVFSIFPDSALRLCLISAILAEMSEEWWTRIILIFEGDVLSLPMGAT